MDLVVLVLSKKLLNLYKNLNHGNYYKQNQ
jgi:hypothetical protein